MKVYAITNQKGGVGKTTTAQNAAAALRLKGKKVLLIDTDGQCNLSVQSRANMALPGAFQIMTGQCALDDAIQETESGVSIIASSPEMAMIEMKMTRNGREYGCWRRALEASGKAKKYDYVIIDTTPSLGIVTLSVLMAADRVVLPAKVGKLELDALEAIQDTIQAAQEGNPRLKVAGILPVMFAGRLAVSKAVLPELERIAGELGTRVYLPGVRMSADVCKAQCGDMDVFAYAPHGKAAADYMEFVLAEFFPGESPAASAARQATVRGREKPAAKRKAAGARR